MKVSNLGKRRIRLPYGIRLSRAVRFIRSKADIWYINPDKITVCGFSAGAHLCASICVHHEDVTESSPLYQSFSNRPDAAILSYPVITAGKYADADCFKPLLGMDIYESDKQHLLDYMSLEKHVTPDTPPCFLWQTAEDELVPVENSALFVKACKEQKVPFAYHVFSKGKHGLSLADETWGYGKLGEPYTMEQIFALVEAVKNGTFPLPEEGKEMLLQHFDVTADNQEAAVRADEISAEVSVWPELAKSWLERL